MTLDFSAFRPMAEQAMVDECVILRDVPGPRDDALNRETNRLEPPANDADTVYSGPCIVSQVNRLGFRDREGERHVYRRTWQVRIRQSAVEVKARDLVLITASPNRPDLVGKRLRVYDVNLNSLATTRKFLAEDDEGTTAR